VSTSNPAVIAQCWCERTRAARPSGVRTAAPRAEAGARDEGIDHSLGPDETHQRGSAAGGPLVRRANGMSWAWRSIVSTDEDKPTSRRLPSCQTGHLDVASVGLVLRGG